MPELVEKGYLYIAQPPLYKVKKGQSEQYLKDEDAFQDFLISQGLEGTTMRLGSGEERGGIDLREVVDQARRATEILSKIHSRYAKFIVEQAAISGALDPEVLTGESGQQLSTEIAGRLDQLSDETEKGWVGEYLENGSLKFSREVRGVQEVSILDAAFLSSTDARKLNQLADFLREIFSQPGQLIRNDDRLEIFGPTDLLNRVFDAGRKGISMQRYKGLGEMNPDQLWETTLDTETRTLLQVKLGVMDETDEIFSKLMGDVVEPRREFIQENALEVANLDI